MELDWRVCIWWRVQNRWLLRQVVKKNRRKEKMQFETLRQVCNSVLSHFHGVFSSPPNILQNDLFGQTLNNTRWVEMKHISLTVFMPRLIVIYLHAFLYDTFIITPLDINIFMVATTLFCWCFSVLCKDLNENSGCRNKTCTDRIKQSRWICIFQKH